MTPAFAMGRLQSRVGMNFPERGKPDKEPFLSGCTTNGIVAGTYFLYLLACPSEPSQGVL